MKTKFIFIIILLLIMTGFTGLLSQNNSSITTDLSINSKQSKQLIDRFNMLRAMDNLESIEQDTILDNISKILLTNKTYKNSTGVYNEDSVRLLLYNNGIIDYQYEIQEISDKDTAAVFKSFLLADKANRIRMGYYKSANKHILLKTKSYLEVDHWSVSCHSETNLDFFNHEGSIPVYTDSVIGHFKILEPDEYYYQHYDRIPTSIDNMNNIEKKKIQTNCGVSMYGKYDFIIKSTGTEVDMWLIISNKNGKRVIVVK